MESDADRFRFVGWSEPTRQCSCLPLAVRGTPGDLEVYCPKCGRVFRAATGSAPSDATVDRGGEA